MAYDHNTDTDNSMHAALNKFVDSQHPVQVASNSSGADMGRTGSLGGAGGISPNSNYNGPEAWTGQAAAPKLVDPRPAAAPSPTFGKRNIYGG